MKEFCFIHRENVRIVCMPSGIPARLPEWVKDQVPGGISGITQVNISWRNRVAPVEIINGRIQLQQPAGIEITVIDGNGIIHAMLETIPSSRPATTHAPEPGKRVLGMRGKTARDKKKSGQQ
jgi:hypothetical protein